MEQIRKYSAKAVTDGHTVVGYLCLDGGGHVCLTHSSDGVDVIMVRVDEETISEHHDDAVWDTLTRKEKELAKLAAFYFLRNDYYDETAAEVLKMLGYDCSSLSDRDLEYISSRCITEENSGVVDISQNTGIIKTEQDILAEKLEQLITKMEQHTDKFNEALEAMAKFILKINKTL